MRRQEIIDRIIKKSKISVNVISEIINLRDPVAGLFEDPNDPENSRVIAAVEERIKKGDVWAWCNVEVRVDFGDFCAKDSLFCASYLDEKEFRQSPYFEEMVKKCAGEICDQLVKNKRILEELLRAA